MPLLRNKYQPYFPDPDRPGFIECQGAYCWPLMLGDKFYQQWYQTPCGANLVEDPTFVDASYGADLITNGDFATDLSGWTTGNWTWVAGTAQAPSPPTANFLTQTIAAGIVGRLYRIRFDVSGLAVNDEINVHLGSTASWTAFSGNGSVDTFIRFRADDLDLSFVQPTTNTGQAVIDNVSLQLVSYTSWNTNGAWNIDLTNERACKTSTGTGNLVNGTSDYMVSGDLYYVVVTFDNITAGSAQVYIDDGSGAETNLQTAITSNGTYEYWITASQDGQIAVKPSSTFLGCVEEPFVYRLRNDYSGDIVSSTGTRYDISPYFQYFEDKVTLNQNIFDLLELPYDCYTIEVFDSCLISGDDLVSNGNFANGSDDWTNNNGGYQYAYGSGYLELIFEPLEGANLITNGGFASGASWTAGAGWTIAAGKATHTPGNTGTLSQTVTTSAPAVAPNTLTHWWQLTISNWTTGTITVTLSDKTSVTFGANDTITSFLIPTIGGSVTFSINPSSSFDGDIDDVSLHESTRIWSAFPIALNAVNTDFVAGNYEVNFDILNITGTTAGTIGVAGAVQGQTQSVTYETTVASHTETVNGYVPGGQRVSLIGRFRVGNNFYPGRVRIDNVEAHRIEPFDATYITECIDYRETFENTQVIRSYSDQDALGFSFADADFYLQFRIEARGMNPFNEREGYDLISGNGSRRRGYVQLEKVYPFFFGYVSDTAHDAIAAAMSTDHLFIGPSESDNVEYIADIENYTPSWREEGDYDLAPGSIQLRKKSDGVKFNRHI